MTSIKPPFPLNSRHALICLLILTTPLAVAETQKTVTGKKATADNAKAEMPTITVTEKIAPTATAKEVYRLPTTTESVTSEKN